MSVRLYTLDEARETLPVIRPVLEELVEASQQLARLQQEVSTTRRATLADGNLVADPWDETPEEEAPLAEAQATVERCLAELNGRGIEVKDPGRGLIDFYHEREGQVVYLCYLLGEPDIEYWHTLEGGFAGRQPI